MPNQVNINQEIARILDDSVLEAYNESIKSYNLERARESLGKFGSYDGKLTGSNPLMLIQLVNAGLLPEGARLATRDDLENVISRDESFLSRNYTDFALALRTANDSYQNNDLLAKKLASQLEKRDIALGKGKLIPLDVLSLAEDVNSAYGLVINLKEDAEKSIKNLDDYKWDYVRGEGLSCADLSRDRSWFSSGEHLGRSLGGGRVVVVSAEDTTKNFQQDDLIQVRSALDTRKAFEYQGTLYVPVSDKSLRITK